MLYMVNMFDNILHHKLHYHFLIEVLELFDHLLRIPNMEHTINNIHVLHQDLSFRGKKYFIYERQKNQKQHGREIKI